MRDPTKFILKTATDLRLLPIFVLEPSPIKPSFFDSDYEGEGPAIHVRKSACDQKLLALHEIGHLFLHVHHGSVVDAKKFGRLFGSINKDYGGVWSYIPGQRSLPATREGYISFYAQQHPTEDWAETFAEVMNEGEACDYDDEILNKKIDFVWECITKARKRR